MRLADSAWLVLLTAVVVTSALWLIRRRHQRFPFPLLAPATAGGRLRLAATVAAGLLAAQALIPLTVALARPQQVLTRKVQRSEGIDIVVVLDVSGSMAALDFKPDNRLAVAETVIGDFLDGRPYDRIGVVVFAGAAVTLCPLTLDKEVVRHLLDGVRIGALPDGTAIGLGLGTAVARLRQSEAASKVVILVTDGANNAGQLDPLTAAELAATQGVVVHTILVGSSGVVPVPVQETDPATGHQRVRVQRLRVEVNPELLAQVSRLTTGTSFQARDADGLRQVFAEIDALEKSELTSSRLVRHEERFEPWALGSLALLLAAALLEGVFGGTPW
jgi:Ca-activated chloride channel family protein